jgi:mono/diheme cytochrome c family protein
LAREEIMLRWFSLVGVACFACVVTTSAQETAKPSAERGRDAVRGKPLMNPPIWSLTALDHAWKTWGLKEKPADHDKAVRERYGLHAAPYDNGGLPMGLHVAASPLGKGVVSDCLLCHAGSVAGQTIIGLGNASLELQGMFDELPSVLGFATPPPVRTSTVRGTIEANAVVTYLMDMRNPDLTLRSPGKEKIKDDLCQDVPAWWLMKKKRTMYHTGAGHARSVRTMMPFLLSPLNSADHIKKLEPAFADIQAYLLTLEAPKYPFAIDKELAVKGEPLFLKHCAKCHGTYGTDASYPSKVVPLETIGTDRRLAEGSSPEFVAHYLKSWFAQEKPRDGKEPDPPQTIVGYQAPPLDGVWATAPYFHNGSAPTLHHVLNSKARPRIFTRSFRTDKDAYDPEKVGWKITVLDQPPDAKMPAIERRKIYDTTQPGRGNQGHTFGDALSDDQRRAVIEYLKTL